MLRESTYDPEHNSLLVYNKFYKPNIHSRIASYDQKNQVNFVLRHINSFLNQKASIKIYRNEHQLNEEYTDYIEDYECLLHKKRKDGNYKMQEIHWDAVLHLFNKYPIIIEIDDKSHFNLQYYLDKGYGDTNDFKRRQCIDRIKNEWCLRNHVPIIRIPYNMSDDDKIARIRKVIGRMLIDISPDIKKRFGIQ